MNFWDYLYIVVALLFAYMTLMIVVRNFQRKFDKDGNRIDLKDKNPKD
jgi:hypothetical protein